MVSHLTDHIGFHECWLKEIGPVATKMPKVRGLRTVKKEILKLIDTYVEKADDIWMVEQKFLPALLDAVLIDYNRNVPDARDAEVLNVMSTIITKLHVSDVLSWRRLGIEIDWFILQSLMEDKVPTIMENVFESTLEMINKDFAEYPEHRVAFFTLLRAINTNCFGGETFQEWWLHFQHSADLRNP